MSKPKRTGYALRTIRGVVTSECMSVRYSSQRHSIGDIGPDTYIHQGGLLGATRINGFALEVMGSQHQPQGRTTKKNTITYISKVNPRSELAAYYYIVLHIEEPTP